MVSVGVPLGLALFAGLALMQAPMLDAFETTARTATMSLVYWQQQHHHHRHTSSNTSTRGRSRNKGLFVSMQDPPTTAASAAANEASAFSKTSTASPSTSNSIQPKYPTARGSEVDSRKIIATGLGRQHLTAVRLAHILFATEELCQASLHQLRAGDVSFETLARQTQMKWRRCKLMFTS